MSQNPSLQTDCSQESDNSATPVNLNADRRHCAMDDPITTDTNDDPADDWPENWEKEWIADDDGDEEEEEEDDEEAECIGEEGRRAARGGGLYKDGHVNKSFSSHTDMLKLDPNLPTPSSAPPLECCVVDRPAGATTLAGLALDSVSITQEGAAGLQSCPQFSFSPQDEYVFNFASTKPAGDLSYSPKRTNPLSYQHKQSNPQQPRHGHHFSFTPPPKLKLSPHAIGRDPSSSSSTVATVAPVLDLLGASLDDLPGAMDTDDDPHGDKSLSSNPGMPLLGNTSSSEDNILMSSYLPNGVLILSPNGDVFARDGATGRNVLVRPKTFANFKNFTTNLPQSMKTLPLKDNRVKSNILSRSRTLDGLNDGAINNDIEPAGSQHQASCPPQLVTSLSADCAPPQSAQLDHLTKEQLYFMWKMSEKELNKRLKRALREKAELEQKLATLQPSDDT